MPPRVEPALDIHQLQEQHRFRKGHRIEEHLLTANLVVDKLLAINTPIWIITLELSRTFDRVSWDKLWVALRAHGVSDQLVWTMQKLYNGQLGQIQNDTGDTCVFPITTGVKQGCMLSPGCCFFFPSLLFPQPSLVQTVLLVSLHANEKREGQKSRAHAGAYWSGGSRQVVHSNTSLGQAKMEAKNGKFCMWY